MYLKADKIHVAFQGSEIMPHVWNVSFVSFLIYLLIYYLIYNM